MMLSTLIIFNFLSFCFGATDFCKEPLGMKRRIILDGQITESSFYKNGQSHKGFQARLDNNQCWCSFTGSTLLNQWVKVDLRYPMSIRGISIQGDPNHNPNYIKKFKLKYSVDGTNFLFKKDRVGTEKEFIGATGQNQKIDRWFDTKPFAARYVEFRPTDFVDNDVCVRFELYGCAYVCNQGLGIESGNALPSGFAMTSSSNGQAASSARLNDASSSWCASTNDQHQYLQIDFGMVMTITGIAVQGNPTADSWVKDFYFDYGMALDSLVTYQEYGSNKLFVGSEDRDTKVTNWFKARLFARYVRIKPISWNGNICMRMEIIGCNTDTMYEIGAENRVLENSRFTASGFTAWVSGRYQAHDGRLNNDRPWGIDSATQADPWFKVDLGRVMLVNGISTQGDGTWGPNYYPDFKIQYSCDENPAAGTSITIKEEASLSVRVFPGNTNNAGVKFNLLTNPISTRHVQFIKNTNPPNVFTLRVEIYGRPQACTTSFGMEAGSQSTYNPTVSVSSGTIPVDKAKLNTASAWCAGTDDVNQYFQYDFGGIRTISGFAIQGHPTDLKWVKTFKVDYKEQQSQSFTTYQDGGTVKTFVGCKSRNLIVYHWFSSNLRMRYLRIKPLTWNTNICLRMNAYGCPKDDCFSELEIQSRATISDGLITSSTQVTGNVAHNGRLNMESVWEACQFGSCTPKEANGNKPWIQVCFPSVKRVSSIIAQGPGDFDNIATVTEFSLKFGASSSGAFQSYIHDGASKKYTVSNGRYTSSQIDLPFSIVSKCIRLQVESQSPANQNAGLRWELLGCNSAPQPSSVTITPSSPSTAKNGDVTLTCTANALPGVGLSWKKGSTVLTTGSVYVVGAATHSSDNVKYEVSMTLKITATTAYVTTSFASCVVTNFAQGSVECKQSYECAASYDSLPSSAKRSTMQVTVTGLQAKPTTPSGITHTSLTNTSFSVSWNVVPATDFPHKDYKAVIKTKADNNVVETKSALASTSTSFSGLNPFTEYIVEISAQSSLNVFSNAGTLEVKTDEGVATAPTNLAAVAISSTSIRLTWNQPTSLNGILYDYKVRYKMASEASYGASISVGTQLTFTANIFKPFSDYEFQVQASTKGGSISGTWSSIAASKTLEGLPSEPSDLQILTIESRRISVRWKKPKNENGIVTNYTVQFIGSKTYNSSFGQQDHVTVQQNTSSESTSSILINLVPGTNYRVEVAATTGAGRGNFSSAVNAKTTYTDPLKPSLHIQGVTNGVVKLSLGSTSNINGPISEYRLYIVQGFAAQCSQSGSVETILPSKIPLALEVKPAIKAIAGISLEIGTVGNYSLCYHAVIKYQSQSFVSKATVYTIERKTLEIVTPDVSEFKSDALVIPLAQGPTNTKNYHVIVLEGNASSKNPNEWLPSELGPYDASTYTTGKPYITAVLSSYVAKFSVGDGKEYSLSNRKRRNVGSVIYKNVPLKANTEYQIFQRAYVSQAEYYSSPWMGPWKTKESTGGGGGGSGGTTGPNPGVIAGIIVPILIIIIMIPIIFVIYRKRKAKGCDDESPHKQPIKMQPIVTNATDNASYNDDEDEATNVETSPVPAPRTHSILERRRSSASSFKHRKIPRSVGHDSRHPAISVQDFARHSKDLQRDSHHGITVEYEDLIKGQQYSWDIAVNADNKPKNRYANISAYDHSRVKLNPIHGVPHSDYYNANHISGYSRNSVYIASQGPVDAGIEDFWRMLWDKNTPAIVMVTNLVERGKKKCAQYWPDMGTAEFGKITVTLLSVENYVDYSIRCLSVTREGSSENRLIYQYHYTTWPDHGIPESPTDLLNLQRKLRKKFPFTSESPILVHCSAGVGRTGTFIVIDAMLELVQSQRKIDVFNYLNFIRSQRIHLVQVEEQYLFIYKALLESITCGMTEIETQNLRIKINQLSTKEKTGQTGFDKQFQRLMLVTPSFNDKETASALSKSNLPKNRRPSVVPREINRVYLQQSIYENDGGTDYINATYVSGYKKKDAYIATQHPLPETINDFWAMIYQSNVSTYVLLNRVNNGPEDYPIFWPESQHEQAFGSVIVANVQEENATDSIERNFIIRHRDSSQDQREVKMFHFQNWPDHGVPKECNKLLTLIGKVEKCQQQQNEDQPVVVVCSDGAGRTGTFITIAIVLERFKTEQLIDVFQTIKKLRAFRPEFVENVVQYKYCHTITQAYMDSFDAYSNFNG